MKLNRQNKASGLLLGVALLVAGTSARADVGPPAVIKMPHDALQATTGVEYAGVFEIHVAKEGVLADFKLEGEGWAVLSCDTPADPGLARVGTLRIPFRAVPQDADQPIRLTCTYDGRRVSTAYEVGPRYFGQVGKGRALRSVGIRTDRTLTAPLPMDASDEQVSPRGGAIPLQFTGRFVYMRSDGRIVGADHILVEVMDDDGLAGDPLVDEVIWSGYTNTYGRFDSNVQWWDDCDVMGCDDPDIYIRFECDTPVGQVQESGIKEEDYHWHTMGSIHEDFEGEKIHFGTMSPPAAEMPAVHIWNSLVRAHRYIWSVTNISVDHVDIQWPESVNGAWYDPEHDEIHIGPDREWNEGTHTHEYGHHFMMEHSAHTEADYCNGFCDGEDCPMCSGVGCPGADPDDCPDPGHCEWCPETNHDAWNEGWPNWLADVVTRSYEEDYEFDDCTPYTALIGRPLEEIDTCCQDGEFHDPYITEGFAAALLRDIEDEKDDNYHAIDDDNEGWPGGYDTTDCMHLGPDQIFDVVLTHQPETPAEFIDMFLTLYPQDTPGLWKTAQNVNPAYLSMFPADTAPPGPITSLYSPTHPSGVGGALPCIAVAFTQPWDDVSGTNGFSVEFTTDPGGVVPPEGSNWSGPCVTRVASRPKDFGTYYVSIRARDFASHWGPPATFGPFVINGDCNSNGIIDLCDIKCDAHDHAEDAGLLCGGMPADFCAVTGCGGSYDCNLNAVPDECDLASGTSLDCDRNGIPDECDEEAGDLIHWNKDGSGSWHEPDNWYKRSACPDPPPPPTCDTLFPADCPAVPVTPDNVCIDVPGSDVTVSYTGGVTEIDVLASYEDLNIAGASFPWAKLTLNEASWIDGDLGISGDHTELRVEDRLDIAGMFNWTGSTSHSYPAGLEGPGVTYANSGVQIVDIVRLNGHLVLDGNTTSITTTGELSSSGNSAVFEIAPGSTYEHQGSGYILSGFTDDLFDNDGTLIKSVDPGESVLSFPIDNSGLIHVQDGTLVLDRPCNSSGDILGEPGTTLDFRNGVREFFPSSSIVADNVMFTRDTLIRGTYDVTTATTHTIDSLTFTSEANIISYGSSFYLTSGTVNFDAIVGGTIQFDTLSLGTGFGTVNFNSGDPVQVANLVIAPGTVQGPSTVTVSTLLTWGGNYAESRIIGPGVLNVNGEMTIEAGGSTKRLNNRVLNNAGTATFLDGLDLDSSAAFNNLAGGVIDVQNEGYVFEVDRLAPFNNAGTLVKSAGVGTSTIAIHSFNSGTVEVQTGELEFHGGWNYGLTHTQIAGQTVLNGGDLAFRHEAFYDIQGGLLTGAGTITGDVVNAGGTAAPGFSAGVIDIDGNYTQTTGGTLAIEICGLTQGSEYDLLTVTDTASLAGNLEVIFPTDGFTPAAGNSFQILASGSVTGQFDSVNVANLPPQLNMEVVYTTGAVTLGMVEVIPGDCDFDGDVDLYDYADWEACLSGPGGGIEPGCGCFDFDDDGDVDLIDFAALQAAFIGS